jgi:hypothetical protein
VPYLLLSLTPRPQVHWLSPSTWVDLGHVEILCWDPPRPACSYGFYVSPGTRWRVLLSVFRPQAARMVCGRGLVGRRSLWRAWRLSQAQLQALHGYLSEVTAGCARGKTRYQALRFNCFHLAYRCLEVAGQRPPRLRRQWIFVFPTLGASSFLAGLVPDAACSSMEADLSREPGKADQWSG